jgi:hypothetical protein
MKPQNFLERLNFYAERLAILPDKVIDTKVVLLVQLLICFIVYASIQAAQLSIVDRCIVPIPSSFIK